MYKEKQGQEHVNKTTDTEKAPMRSRRRVTLAFKLNILIVTALVCLAVGLVLIAFFLNSRQIENLYIRELENAIRTVKLTIGEEFADWIWEQIDTEEFWQIKDRVEQEHDPELLENWLKSRPSEFGEEFTEYSLYDEREAYCAYLKESQDTFHMESVLLLYEKEDEWYILASSDADVMKLGSWDLNEDSRYELRTRSGSKAVLYEVQGRWLCTVNEVLGDMEQGDADEKALVFASIGMDMVQEETHWFLINCLLFLLVFIAVLIPVSVFVIRRVAIRPLRILQKGSDRFSEGEGAYTMDQVVHMNRSANDEISDLYRGVRSMQTRIVRDLDKLTRITAERERIETELSLAAQIQQSALPDREPDFSGRPEFSLSASMDPAKDVGGDFYDFFYQNEQHLALVIADVSGKGIPAALFMMSAKNLIKNRAAAGGTPAEILASVNAQLARNNTTHMFVTVWLGILDLQSGMLTACSAGHEEPVIRKKGGDFALLHDKRGFVLGGLARSRYQDYEVALQPGDTIFLYTDGVPEAANAKREFYGLERLTEALNRPEASGPDEILAAVKADVERFVSGTEPSDDLTMVCIRYRS